jgi:dethiobiotin synthetase
MKIFVTGTDTGVGKTTISVGLLKAFNQVKPAWATVGLKPIASGADRIEGFLYNEDGLSLQAASSKKLPYLVVNPFVFEAPVAPHIAARQAGSELRLNTLLNVLNDIFQNFPADVYIVEGAGGWHVPLNDHELYSSVVQALQLPVILVIGMKLGCLNHSLLTENAILSSGVPLIGWIANMIDPHMPVYAENLGTLRTFLKSPCLGVVPYGEQAMDHIDIEKILIRRELSLRA